MNIYTLDHVLDQLHEHRQRATYGAVGAVVDRPPRYLMGGRPRDQRHSWIVNQDTGLPTGYGPDDMHPQLQSNPDVIKTGADLDAWLRDHDTSPRP